MLNQQYIVRNKKGVGLGLGASIREQASQLPSLYAMRMQNEYTEEGLGLKREELGLQRQAQKQSAKQWQEQKKMTLEAQEAAKGQMMLQGGMGAIKLAAGKGMFDNVGDRFAGVGDKVGGLFGGAKATPANQIDPNAYGENQPWVGNQYSFVNDPKYTGEGQPQPSGGQSSGGEPWYSGASAGLWGGASGGMFGSGAAKTFGAKKKWQTAAAGAAGGMLSSWMMGADNPFSIALGGMVGGGLGALL